MAVAVATQVPYANAKTLLSFLEEDDKQSQTYALDNLLSSVDYLWHELIDHIETFKEEYDHSLTYALEAGELLDIRNRDLFTSKIISKAFDKYVVIQTFNQTAAEEDRLPEDQNLNRFINEIFEDSVNVKIDAKLVLGIAIETRRIIKNSNYDSDLLGYLFDLSQKVIQSKVFKLQVVNVILNYYSQRAEGSGIGRGEAANISFCYLLLNKPQETALILTKLISTGVDDDTLTALQIASDIIEEENAEFNEKLHSFITEFKDENSETNQRKQHLLTILTGQFNETSTFKFVNRSNHSNKAVFSKLWQYWFDKKNSIYHNDDTYLNEKSNEANLGKNGHWARFLSVACLGTIHKFDPKIDEVLQKHYPEMNKTNDYSAGGSLYAQGLALCQSITNTSKTRKITKLLELLEQNDKEPIVHGAALGVGLMGMSSHNLRIIEKLRPLIYKDSAIMGEAAAYSIGLVMAGHMDAELIEELLNTCRENTHEKIIRGLAVSLALMAYKSEETAEPLIEQLMSSKDHVVRYGGAQAIGMAYVGTGNTKAVKRLLSIAASDVNDDVRRAAVISIAFVMLNQSEKVPKIINLLIESYNPQVRYGAAMAVGIACAGTSSKEAMQALERLQSDTSAYVRQGAVIALGFVMQQATKNNNPIVDEFKERLLESIKKRNEDSIFKFGAMLSLGILDAGGRNCLVTLTTPSGSCKKGAIIGMVMFTQFWYWFPFVQMLSVALAPTFIVGVNKDLKMPKGFVIKQNCKKSMFDYPPIKKIDEGPKDKDKVTVELSTTRRAKARQANRKGDPSLKHTESMRMEEEALQKQASKIEAEAKEKKGMDIEESTTCELSNPLARGCAVSVGGEPRHKDSGEISEISRVGEQRTFYDCGSGQSGE